VQAAVPALAKLCAKGVAKGGKSVFKFKGKDYEVKVDKPLTTKRDREPSDTPTRVPENTNKPSSSREGMRNPKETNIDWQNPVKTFKDKVCNYAIHDQACLHYSSVMSRRPALRSITCVDNRAVGGNIREVRNEYANKHHVGWYEGWMRAENVACERDEFPPAALWQGRDKNVWIRFTPHKGNNLAGKLFMNICPDNVRTETIGRATSDHRIRKNGRVCRRPSHLKPWH
jgi:chitinase